MINRLAALSDAPKTPAKSAPIPTMPRIKPAGPNLLKSALPPSVLGSTTGINTGSFNWIYGKSANSPLMTLTYGGRLGLGVTVPNSTLHVVGTSTVTGNSFIDGSCFITGNLNVNGIIFTATGIDLNGRNVTGTFTGPLSGNVNAISGISTFNQLQVNFPLSIKLTLLIHRKSCYIILYILLIFT